MTPSYFMVALRRLNAFSFGPSSSSPGAPSSLLPAAHALRTGTGGFLLTPVEILHNEAA